ncbi:MAG TPA: hypothetical protein VJ901_02095 [Thermoanaerobaculia bacterium]|nr:hypothetical protein [Thermoanaerobaculia bacterium]
MKRVLLGLFLVLLGIVTYAALFVRWPVTRDVPWTAFALFVIALVLMIGGLRNAPRKVWPSIVTAIGVALMAFFTVGVTVFTLNLPASQGSPAIGAKAPDFTLPDTNHKSVTLSQLTASSNVLLIFYRGYW